jgi:hypothetical protein
MNIGGHRHRETNARIGIYSFSTIPSKKLPDCISIAQYWTTVIFS